MGRIAEMRRSLAKKVYEALSGTALGDWGTGGDRELLGYSRITGRNRDGKLLRDLTPMSQEQQCQVAMYLYATNPLAAWLIDQRVDLLVGQEVGYSVEFDAEKLGISKDQAKERAAQAKEVLDKFWDHPSHSIRFRAAEYITTLMVSGELCLAIGEANDVDGVPELDCVDSQLISGVEPLQDSSMVAGAVLIRRPDQMAGAAVRKTIVRHDFERDRLAGEVFFWRNARLLNAMRGRSELMAPADFLDSLDQFMFSQVDRALLQNNVVWRLKLEGANDTQIKERVQALRAELAKPGGIFGHNEKGELEAAAPQLAAAEGSEVQRTLANHIRGSKSMPESWYAEGGNANRATASDQTDVAFKSLERWQTLTRQIFNTLLFYAYDNLQELQEGAGFPKRSSGAVTLNVDMLPVRERDMSRAATTGAQVETMLQAAIDDELISRKTARKVFLQVVEKISGTAVDPDDEEAAIEAEAEEREKKEREQMAAAARAGLGPKLGPMPTGGDDDDAPPARRPPPNGNGNGRVAESTTPPHSTSLHVHIPAAPAPSVTVPPAQIPITVQPAAPAIVVQPSPPGQTVVESTVVVPPQPPAQTHVDVHVPPVPARLEVAIVDQPATEQTVERDESSGRIEKTITRPVQGG